MKNCKILFFADDTVIYNISNSFEDSLHSVQSDLNMLHLWCRDNLLEINASKTKSMFFNSKYLNSSSKPRQKLSLGKTKMDWVLEYKYLGVTIDSSLTMNKHVKNVIKNVSFRLCKLRRIRKFLTKRTTLLYLTLQYSQYLTMVIYTIIVVV